jgi:hypothetical protein
MSIESFQIATIYPIWDEKGNGKSSKSRAFVTWVAVMYVTQVKGQIQEQNDNIRWKFDEQLEDSFHRRTPLAVRSLLFLPLSCLPKSFIDGGIQPPYPQREEIHPSPKKK